MVQVQFDKREINCKVVYYGPEGAGKTANLHAIQAKAPRGSLSALCCGPGSDLALEHLQVDLGRVDEMRTKLHVYAIPARTPEETRRRILRGCDALVFVANGRPEQLAANRESLDLLTADLAAVELSLAGIPLVVQWNHWGATARG